MRTNAYGLICALLFAMALPVVAAETYPSRPIRLIVPFPAGGGVDLTGRAIAQKISEAWGQTVVADNRSGANGVIGADLAAKGTADGGAVPAALAVGATRKWARCAVLRRGPTCAYAVASS